MTLYRWKGEPTSIRSGIVADLAYYILEDSALI